MYSVLGGLFGLRRITSLRSTRQIDRSGSLTMTSDKRVPGAIWLSPRLRRLIRQIAAECTISVKLYQYQLPASGGIGHIGVALLSNENAPLLGR